MKSSDIIANVTAGFSIFVTLLVCLAIFLTFWDTLIAVTFGRSTYDLSLLVLKGDLIFGRV